MSSNKHSSEQLPGVSCASQNTHLTTPIALMSSLMSSTMTTMIPSLVTASVVAWPTSMMLLVAIVVVWMIQMLQCHPANAPFNNNRMFTTSAESPGCKLYKEIHLANHLAAILPKSGVSVRNAYRYCWWLHNPIALKPFLWWQRNVPAAKGLNLQRVRRCTRSMVHLEQRNSQGLVAISTCSKRNKSALLVIWR